MAYADQLARLLTHARTAGNAATPAITDVQVAYPAPRGRCGRLFYAGEAEPARMGVQRTLNSELVADQVAVVFFWPLSNVSETQASAIETEIVAVKHALRVAILGDSQLNDTATDLELEYVEPGFANLAGIPYRTLEAVVTVDFAEYTITP